MGIYMPNSGDSVDDSGEDVTSLEEMVDVQTLVVERVRQ